jgi:hypothetical protein
MDNCSSDCTRLSSTYNDVAWVEPISGPAVTVGVVNLHYAPESFTMPIQGFGYLIPKMELNPEDVFGVLFASSFAESQGQGRDAEATKLTVMMDGHYWQDRSSYPSDDDLLDMAGAVFSSSELQSSSSEIAANLGEAQSSASDVFCLGRM